MVRQTHHKMVKIYTKKGDKGETSLRGGYKVSKSDPRVEAYGNVDELNSVIGIAIVQIQSSRLDSAKRAKLKSELIKVQQDLFGIGSVLASSKEEKVEDLEKRINEIESLIDEFSEKLPELRNFILPGGGICGSALHFARTVTRRGERRIVELSKKEKIDSSILIYLNRLSDFLFVIARFINFKENKKEIIWSFEAKASQDKSKNKG